MVNYSLVEICFLFKGIKQFRLTARTSEIIDIGKMPASCSDLQRMGHKLSGFFSVKGLTKMEMVHCDFNLNQNGKTLKMVFFTLLGIDYLIYFIIQTNKNGLDTPTSNQRQSISTSREVLPLVQKILQFRTI
jgi:hypothetical protein